MVAEGNQESSVDQLVLEAFHTVTIQIEDSDKTSSMMSRSQNSIRYTNLMTQSVVRRGYMKISSRIPAARF
jgi:hypothetical protein